MPSAASDRALRRLVADLASAGDEDVAAVLGALAPGEREKVAALLGTYSGAPSEAPAASVTPIVEGMPDLQGLSPWLAARLGHGPERAQRTAAQDGLTSTSLAALRASAAALPRAAAAAAPAPRPSLLGQLRRGLLAGRPAS